MKNFKPKYYILALLGVTCLVVFILVFVDLTALKINNLFPVKAKVAGYQLVVDKYKMFSVEIPSDWSVNAYAPGSQILSGANFKSKDFKVTMYDTNPSVVMPIKFEAGAALTISIVGGIVSEKDIISEELMSQKDVVIDGVPAKYYVFTNLGIQDSESHEVRFNYGGNNYLIKMVYNPSTLQNGPKLFSTIYSTFKFTRTQ